jgi:Rap1a immunity proteins
MRRARRQARAGTEFAAPWLWMQEQGAMRSIVVISLAAIAWASAPAPARAQNTNELLGSCEAVTKAARADARGTIDIPPAGLPCWYYMAAIQNAAVLVDQDGGRLLGICAPPEATLLDHVRIFVRYARRNQKDASDNAAAVAVAALSEAYPCRTN